MTCTSFIFYLCLDLVAWRGGVTFGGLDQDTVRMTETVGRVSHIFFDRLSHDGDGVTKSVEGWIAPKT